MFFFLPLINAPVTASEKIKVAVSTGLALRYDDLLTKQKINVNNLSDAGIKGATRGFIQLIIIKQALYKGGLDVDFEFIEAPNEQRSNVLISEGKTVISHHLLPQTSQPSNTFKSTVIMESRTLKKGIYGLSTNKTLMNVKSIEDLKPLKGVLMSSWPTDIKTLENAGITQLALVPKYQNIFTRIAHRGTDYTLLEHPYFHGKSYKNILIQHMKNIKLFPVPNIVIAMEDSRHFYVSKKHTDGKRIFTALEKGLKIMKDEGTIKKYFQQINVIRKDLDDYKVLN